MQKYFKKKKRLDDAYPHWRGKSLFTPPRQMLVSFRDSPTDTPRNNVHQLSEHSLASQVDTLSASLISDATRFPELTLSLVCPRSGTAISARGLGLF